MKHWDCANLFPNSEIVIVGGGRSLVDFDFGRIRDKICIGLNHSGIVLGSDICNICFFSDKSFWELHRTDLERYSETGGLVCTHNPTLAFESHPSWLLTLDRKTDGLHLDSIGYGYGSGPSSVNLALMLGAVKVSMIGFDGGSYPDGKNHWHTERKSSPNPESYTNFYKGFKKAASQLASVYPGREVIVYSDKTKLDMFPVRKIAELI